MLPPDVVSFVLQFDGTPSPVLPAMIEPATVIFSASLVNTPSPPFWLPAFAAIVERVIVVTLAALSRVEMPGAVPGGVLVDGRVDQRQRVGAGAGCPDAHDPAAVVGGPPVRMLIVALLSTMLLVSCAVPPLTMPMPPPRYALPPVTREWSSSRIAPALTRMLPPTPSVVELVHAVLDRHVR